MFGLPLGIIVETSVAILLATTIGYCVILNQRLKRLHADRDALRTMIADLVQATSLANSAVQELKTAALEADTQLNSRLEQAEKFGIELANHVAAGRQLMDKIAKITSLARNNQPFEEKLAEPNKVQSALQQLAMRPRIRGDAA
ncbi:MAG TPA: chemotaxis protein [Alphaproteobacteria bacterium]|nr:chemotaxis protein [Alphaproteobacteria bacterium]